MPPCQWPRPSLARSPDHVLCRASGRAELMRGRGFPASLLLVGLLAYWRRPSFRSSLRWKMTNYPVSEAEIDALGTRIDAALDRSDMQGMDRALAEVERLLENSPNDVQRGTLHYFAANI